MDSIDDIIKHLPDLDLQIRRYGKRRVFPCPSCGENVRGCHAVKLSPKRPLENLGLRIPCPKCGDFTVSLHGKGGDGPVTVVETGAVYDSNSRVAASAKRYRDISDEKDKDSPEHLLRLAKAAAEYAGEIKLASPSDIGNLWIPYLVAVSTYCNLVSTGHTEHVEALARLTLECNNIAKYELMEQMVAAYDLMEEHQDKLPRALFLKMMIERALVDSAFASGESTIFDDEPYTDTDCYDQIAYYAEAFESLPAEERAVCPYAAADGWSYVLKDRERCGKGIKTVAKKVISSIRKALKDGAPEDRDHIITMISCHAKLFNDTEKPYRDMIADAKHWSDPLFLAMADFLFAEHLYCTAAMEFDYDVRRMPGKALTEAVERLTEAIGIMEKEDDVTGFAYMLADAYRYRGSFTGKSSEKKLSCYYIMYFAMIGQATNNDVLSTLMAVSVTEKFGSPLQKWAMARLGLPS